MCCSNIRRLNRRRNTHNDTGRTGSFNSRELDGIETVKSNKQKTEQYISVYQKRISKTRTFNDYQHFFSFL